MKIDLIFLIVLGIVIAYVFMLYKVEKMADVGSIDQIKEAVKQVYLADVEAIRNLSTVASQLQANGLTVPAHMNIKGKMNIGSDANAKDFPEWLGLSVENPGDAHIRLKTKADENKNVYLINRDSHFRVNTHGIGDMFGVNRDGHTYSRHTGDHVFNFNGDGNNPYISLGKTDTWNKKKLYIQNADAHTENPTFRVGIHGDRMLMNMNKSHGVYWPRKDGRNTHFDWEDGRNYIRGETINDGNFHVNGGALCINGKCINENHLSMLVDGFKLQTLDNGWHGGSWIHTHGNGNMARADPQYRTTYKLHPKNT